MGYSDNYPYYPIFPGGAIIGWPYGWGSAPAASNCPPSPEPPWSRLQKSPLAQTITQADNVSLTLNPTMLDQTLNIPAAPVAITIPNGSRVGQYKQIMIRGDKIANTETFNLAGTFAGFTSLTFNTLGFVATLMWDGAAWQLVGGNPVVNQ